MISVTRRTLLLSTAGATAVAALCSGAPNARAQSAGTGIADRRPTIPATTLDLGDFCAGDGVTNDANGLQEALDRLDGLGGGTLSVPAKTFLIEPRGWIMVPGNVAIVGASSGSRFVLQASSRTSYSFLFRADNDNVVIENLSMVRGNDVFGSFLGLFASNIWVHGVDMAGHIDEWDNDFNGIRVATRGRALSGFTLSDTTVGQCGYGLYLSEAEANEISDVVIDNFLGRQNVNDDLELCAPLGSLTGVSITNSTFVDNRSTGVGSGFGIGLANANDATISNCAFTNYSMNAIHIEHRSRGVQVRGCTFTNVSTRETGYAAAIIILSASSQVTVADNTFDLSQQSNGVNAVYAGPGGAGWDSPTDITVTGNTVRVSGSEVVLANYGDGTNTVTGNTVTKA